VRIKARIVCGIKERTFGLVGKKKPYPLLIQTRFGIHTFFLKFPIDVAVLDKNNRIVKLRQNLAPNRIFVWNPKYDKVLELPEGTVKKFHLTRGLCVNKV